MFYEDIVSCVESGQHLKSCDEDGFCNNCGYQEESFCSLCKEPKFSHGLCSKCEERKELNNA